MSLRPTTLPDLPEDLTWATHVKDRHRDWSIIHSPTLGSATLDWKRKAFSLGWNCSPAWGTKPLEGRSWRKELIDQAVAQLLSLRR
jgi:hypothetical protein